MCVFFFFVFVFFWPSPGCRVHWHTRFCNVCCMSIYLQLPTTTATAASNESACVAVCALIFKRLHGNLLTPSIQRTNPDPESRPRIQDQTVPKPKPKLKPRRAPRKRVYRGGCRGRRPKGLEGVGGGGLNAEEGQEAARLREWLSSAWRCRQMKFA